MCEILRLTEKAPAVQHIEIREMEEPRGREAAGEGQVIGLISKLRLSDLKDILRLRPASSYPNWIARKFC